MTDASRYGGIPVQGLTLEKLARLTGTVFNVKTFGAAGDGTTNDTAAIQAAIDAAEASSRGGVVYIPSGDYPISSTLTIDQALVSVMGAGQNSTRLKANSGFSGTGLLQLASLSGSGLYGFFRDFAISGQSNVAIGLELLRPVIATVENAEIGYCTQAGLWFQQANQLWVRGCVFGSNNAVGIQSGMALSNNVWITDNSSIENTSHGYYLSLIRDFVVDNNLASDCGGKGFYVYGTANRGSVRGNIADGCGEDGFYLNGDLVVSDNQANANDEMGFRFDGLNGGTVTGNISRDNSQGSVGTYPAFRFDSITSPAATFVGNMAIGTDHSYSLRLRFNSIVHEANNHLAAATSGTVLVDAGCTLDSLCMQSFKVSNTQVVSSRRVGWGAPTGTATRGTFATGSVTLPQLAERVKALVDDLTTHGLIGPVGESVADGADAADSVTLGLELSVPVADGADASDSATSVKI